MTVTFPRNVIGFPDRLVTVLKYSESYSFSGSPNPAAQRWTVNSAFDPNSTGAGHQPSYYDTFQAIYGRYFVRHFHVEIELVNHTSTCGVFAVAAYADIDISGNTVEQIIEAKYSVYKALGFSTGSSQVVKISLPWMSTLKLMGQPFAEADDNMYAAVNANPADFAHCFMKVAADDASTNVSLIARVVLYQEVVFKDLLTQVSS